MNLIFSSPPRATVSDRRHHKRYPFAATAAVFADKDMNEATIENLSVGGAFFQTQTALIPGTSVRLVIDWPVKVEGRVPLVLHLKGTVVRVDNTGIAVAIQRHSLGPRE